MYIKNIMITEVIHEQFQLKMDGERNIIVHRFLLYKQRRMEIYLKTF